MRQLKINVIQKDFLWYDSNPEPCDLQSGDLSTRPQHLQIRRLFIMRKHSRTFHDHTKNTRKQKKSQFQNLLIFFCSWSSRANQHGTLYPLCLSELWRGNLKMFVLQFKHHETLINSGEICNFWQCIIQYVSKVCVSKLKLSVHFPVEDAGKYLL